MKKEILELNNILLCPVCGETLDLSDDKKSFTCRNTNKKHCFDVASSGYVNLICGNKSGNSHGDSKDMVRARSAFLENGYYQPFCDAVISAAEKYNGKEIVDAGCGEGYYTNQLANKNARVFGFDMSKYSVEHAAKTAKRMDEDACDRTFYAAASIFDMPIKTGSIDVVVNLFAPFAGAEFSRILKKGGYVICGTAGEEHLIDLKKAIYDVPYKNETRNDISAEFSLAEKIKVKYKFSVNENEMIKNLFMMTPYAFRTSEKDKEKLDKLEKLDILADFDILVLKKNA